MPTGSSHGWGIAGSYLRAELAKLPPLEGVTLHCISGHDFRPFDASAWDQINIGYCFFEHELLAAPFIAEAAKRWDYIVAGSSWCQQQLERFGMPRTSTILQGIDATRFAPQPLRNDDGRFIVFSGGKFEFRKGQDIVIAAMRVFMQRHTDVWLSCAWHNAWPDSIKTMQQSRLIDIGGQDLPCQQLLRETVVRAGLDSGRVLLHPPFDNRRMPLIYAESDLGLFPNRCEGGNNLVMCEYMACGRPVIASDQTGQADVISRQNAWPLTRYQPVTAMLAGHPTGNWQEPSVEEVVELLEQAYADHSALQHKGQAAAREMQRLNWGDAARRFHAIGQTLSAGRQPSTVSLIRSGDTQKNLDSSTEEADRLFHQGDFNGAEARYRESLQRHPLHPGLHNSLGTVLAHHGRQTEAVAHYRKALNLAPGFTSARFNLANSLAGLEDLQGALEQLQQVLAEQPDLTAAWQSQACCCQELGDTAGAIASLEQVVSLAPDHAGAWEELGRLYVGQRQFEAALRCYDNALEQSPGKSAVVNARGLVLHELERLDEAAGCFKAVLEQEQHHAVALNNLGNVYKSGLQLAQALDCYHQALVCDPGNPTIIFNRSLLLLLQGDFERGWPGFERRFEMIPPVILPHPEIPCWQGEPLGGRTLLVQAEQVYGDTLMFARFLPLVARCGGPVVFQCQDQIIRPALHGLEGVLEQIVVRGEPLPPVDLQIPLLSLPGLMRMGLDTIPAPHGYLTAAPDAVERWRPLMAAAEGIMKIGLVWGGRKAPLNANRSMQLNDLAELLELDGVGFYSLQLGDDAEQLSDHTDRVVDLGAKIKHFGDTAAVIQQLDLVITIDTAVAHLAGALGRPVWVLLKYSPDWRWLLERSDSPWYASARLFRQATPESGWKPVVKDICTILSDQLAGAKKTAKVFAGG
jgi:tetratricopeptide (TPR) repeat protein